MLETLGKMRGGRSPTEAEVEMMSEARGKLAEVCREFKPKDVFPREAFGVVMDDLGLSKMNEQMLGFRAPNVPIAQKLKLTQEKVRLLLFCYVLLFEFNFWHVWFWLRLLYCFI